LFQIFHFGSQSTAREQMNLDIPITSFFYGCLTSRLRSIHWFLGWCESQVDLILLVRRSADEEDFSELQRQYYLGRENNNTVTIKTFANFFIQILLVKLVPFSHH
jgi:hypothetical protein